MFVQMMRSLGVGRFLEWDVVETRVQVGRILVGVNRNGGGGVFNLLSVQQLLRIVHLSVLKGVWAGTKWEQRDHQHEIA